MKVTHLISFLKSGAGVAAYRLHKGLLEAGYDSNILTLSDEYNEKEKIYGIFSKLIQKSLFAAIHERYRLFIKRENDFKNKIACNEPFSKPYSPFKLSYYSLIKKSDILHLHQTSEFADIPDLFSLNKKYVWTLHDIYPFTAGCHYSEGCLKFKEACYPCPQLKGVKNPGISIEYQQSKQRSVKKNKLTIVGPSQWIVDSSKSSTIFSALPHKKIVYGLDTSIFKFYDKKLAREKLGLPLEKKILVCVADNLKNKRKGIQLLFQALQNLPVQNVLLCLLGKKLDYDIDLAQLKIFQAGYVSDEYVLSDYLNAADVFVHPALEDNFPNVVLEAVCCGLPVIGFSVGGMPDMVDQGKNGWLTSPLVTELTQSISEGLNNSALIDRQSNSVNARQKFGLNMQADAYMNIYTDICSN